MQNSVISITNTSLHWFQPSSVVFACKTVSFGSGLQVSVSQTSPVVLCMQNSVICTKMTSLYGFQPSSVVLCNQKSDIRTRIACLHGPQTSPVILCMQIGVPSIRITSVYGFQPSSVLFGCKTSTFGSE